jgi:carbonic anhydrase
LTSARPLAHSPWARQIHARRPLIERRRYNGKGMTMLPQRLREGYAAFRDGRLAAEQSRYRDLAEHGQTPQSMVIGCCDSRVSPEVIFDVGPGELFVVRNIANLIPPYSPDSGYHGVSSALEYGAAILKVRHIVVLGHARCGGVQAFAEGAAAGDFIGRWISLLEPAAAAIGPSERAADDFPRRLEQASIIASLQNLRTFPFIKTRCDDGTLTLHGAYFAVASGELSALDPASGRFVPVTPPSASPR